MHVFFSCFKKQESHRHDQSNISTTPVQVRVLFFKGNMMRKRINMSYAFWGQVNYDNTMHLGIWYTVVYLLCQPHVSIFDAKQCCAHMPVVVKLNCLSFPYTHFNVLPSSKPLLPWRCVLMSSTHRVVCEKAGTCLVGQFIITLMSHNSGKYKK